MWSALHAARGALERLDPKPTWTFELVFWPDYDVDLCSDGTSIHYGIAGVRLSAVLSATTKRVDPVGVLVVCDNFTGILERAVGACEALLREAETRAAIPNASTLSADAELDEAGGDACVASRAASVALERVRLATQIESVRLVEALAAAQRRLADVCIAHAEAVAVQHDRRLEELLDHNVEAQGEAGGADHVQR
jgi:prophage DNA circulation protein